MNIVLNQNLTFAIHGFSGTAMNKDYSGTAFKLMDKMWQTVKSNNLTNKGLNVWVYEDNDSVFSGVELKRTANTRFGIGTKKNYP